MRISHHMLLYLCDVTAPRLSHSLAEAESVHNYNIYYIKYKIKAQETKMQSRKKSKSGSGGSWTETWLLFSACLVLLKYKNTACIMSSIPEAFKEPLYSFFRTLYESLSASTKETWLQLCKCHLRRWKKKHRGRVGEGGSAAVHHQYDRQNRASLLIPSYSSLSGTFSLLFCFTSAWHHLAFVQSLATAVVMWPASAII